MYTVAQKITPTQHQILLIGKRVVDFLSVLIELFSLGVTAEALRVISVHNRRFRSTGAG